jgi:hypothetical protein
MRRKLYFTQVLDVQTAWGPARHLVVGRYDGKPGISWDVLQALKNEMLGPDACAVEFFPPAHKVVDEVNRRHLWEVPKDLELPMSPR